MDIYTYNNKNLDNKSVRFVDSNGELKEFKIGKTLEVDKLKIGSKYTLNIFQEYVNGFTEIENKAKFDLNKNILIQHYSSDASKLLELLESNRNSDDRNKTRDELLEEHELIVRRLLSMHKRLLEEQ